MVHVCRYRWLVIDIVPNLKLTFNFAFIVATELKQLVRASFIPLTYRSGTILKGVHSVFLPSDQSYVYRTFGRTILLLQSYASFISDLFGDLLILHEHHSLPYNY